jgi:hypothetical protein
VAELLYQLSDKVNLFDLNFWLLLVQIVALHCLRLSLETVEELTKHLQLSDGWLVLHIPCLLAPEIVVHNNCHINVRFWQISRQRVRAILEDKNTLHGIVYKSQGIRGIINLPDLCNLNLNWSPLTISTLLKTYPPWPFC